MRKRYLPLAVMSLMVSPAYADSCDTAEDQATMTLCARQSYQAVDGHLNALYHQIRQRLGDDVDALRLFRDAERQWIAFRDAECEFATASVAGGSVYPMIYDGCLEELTAERVARFETYLACEEGDMSCPVPAGE
ncbi:lysozyme inhibitor LprI family protein [Pararhodobacter zhoushanensis]|uniref:lysozyme inhibitor LprI family protein n=1 Tax=Pararhodobacter zhoushanensis TaxID=2479545 RepID=UPI000F8DF24F|nr:lysozyme inhibitor LprI family protein [Pararhodobacter zhoushanensis]